MIFTDRYNSAQRNCRKLIFILFTQFIGNLIGNSILFLFFWFMLPLCMHNVLFWQSHMCALLLVSQNILKNDEWRCEIKINKVNIFFMGLNINKKKRNSWQILNWMNCIQTYTQYAAYCFCNALKVVIYKMFICDQVKSSLHNMLIVDGLYITLYWWFCMWRKQKLLLQLINLKRGFYL